MEKKKKPAPVKIRKRQYSMIGKSFPRPDGADKVTGMTEYIADMSFGNGLVAVIKSSDIPHGEIIKIDTSAAEKLPGVYAVMTAKDIPGENQIGVVQQDQPCLAEKKVRYIGEAVAIVAAENRRIGEEACRLIKVEYKKLPGIFDVETGMADTQPRVHEKAPYCTHMVVHKGNAESAFKRCDIVVEHEYQTHHQEHAYLETNGCAAVPGKDGSMTIYGSMQCPFYVQKAVAIIMGIPYNKVRVIQTPTGGAFGGKEDIPSEFCAKAALLAWKTGRPVKLILTREEDIQMTSKRHPFRIRIKLGATKKGILKAVKVYALADSGAYATLSPIVVFRANVHAAGAYIIPNVDIDVYGVYTNQIPCGAFRGFGSPQVHYAIESIIDELAVELKIDPLRIRLRNCLKLGTRTATDQVLEESVGLKQTIRLAEDKCDWERKMKAYVLENKTGRSRYYKGIGMAIAYYGNSLGAKGWHLDGAGALVQLMADGTANVSIGGTELGQGASMISCQIVAEVLGLTLEDVRFLPSDTSMVPDSGPTVASRTTTIGGGAVLDAAQQIRQNMLPLAAARLNCQPEDVVLKNGFAFSFKNKSSSMTLKALAKECFNNKIHLAAQGWFHAPKCEWDDKTGLGDAYYTYSYMTHVAEVEVCKITGQVRVNKITAVHDIGTVINPAAAVAQVQGGVAQGIGYSVFEGFKLKEGLPVTRNFATYILPTAKDVPDVDVHFVEERESHGPYGAKSLGEPPIIPVGAAIANAVYHATGVRIRELPLLPELVWKAMKHNKEESS